MMTGSFLITGCGRSGTAWAARLFTELGYPCTHEGQFNLARSGPLTGGESSWLAIPHLDSLDSSTPILRIMRDPYQVVQSAMARRFLRDPEGPYEKYAIRHCQGLGNGRGHLGRVIRWVALWDSPLMDYRVHGLRAEWGTRDVRLAVRRATGDRGILDERVSTVLHTLGKKTNTSPLFSHTQYVTREQIDAHPDGSMIRRRAKKFGYI
jgi:hypothetical protein